MNQGAKSPELELRVASDWGEVGRVNEAVSGFLRRCALPTEAIDKYTMVVCELVENGIKYGHFTNDRDVVDVRVWITGGSISVLVSNPIGSYTQTYLGELDRTIQWVRGFQAPFEAYIARMKAISREPLDIDKSGLGLVRITYEGQALLDFYLDENNTLSVSAVSNLE
ncbi:MAG TPA: ATP-binding protein [Spirochaetia bacterium]|nr:ATP-binding protein [Spirochaetia bacterium]